MTRCNDEEGEGCGKYRLGESIVKGAERDVSTADLEWADKHGRHRRHGHGAAHTNHALHNREITKLVIAYRIFHIIYYKEVSSYKIQINIYIFVN